MRLNGLIVRISLTLAAVVIGVMLPTPAARADDPDFVPRQALVRLNPGVGAAAFASQYGLTVLQSIPERNIHLFGLPESPDEPEFVDQFNADSRVVFADLNFLADDTNPDGTTQDIFLARSAQQYQEDVTPELIGARGGQVAARGQGVVVAVIDTGVDAQHPLLAGRIAPGGYNFIDENTNTADQGPGTFAGHGTIVAGVIVRIAPEVRVLPIRALDATGQSTTFRLARGIYHAIDQGASIINISMGTTGDPSLLRDAVAEAAARNVLVVAAAGNDNNESPPRFPAGLGDLGVVAVAALDQMLVKTDFSNYGSWISIAAPGVDVHGPTPGGGFGSAKGTSFAAPLVSGVAALVRSACPSVSAAATRSHLLAGAMSIEALNPSYPGQLGVGSVDARGALASALYTAPPCRCLADFNGSGTVTVQDTFEFLFAWFDGSPLGDVNHSGDLGVGDIFTYLNAFFVGCP